MLCASTTTLLLLLSSFVVAYPDGAPGCVVDEKRISKMGGSNTDLNFRIHPSALTYARGQTISFTLDGTRPYKGILLFLSSVSDPKRRVGNFEPHPGFKTNKPACDKQGILAGPFGALTQDSASVKPAGTVFSWNADTCEDALVETVVAVESNVWQILPTVVIRCRGGRNDAPMVADDGAYTPPMDYVGDAPLADTYSDGVGEKKPCKKGELALHTDDSTYGGNFPVADAYANNDAYPVGADAYNVNMPVPRPIKKKCKKRRRPKRKCRKRHHRMRRHSSLVPYNGADAIQDHHDAGYPVVHAPYTGADAIHDVATPPMDDYHNDAIIPVDTYHGDDVLPVKKPCKENGLTAVDAVHSDDIVPVDTYHGDDVHPVINTFHDDVIAPVDTYHGDDIVPVDTYHNDDVPPIGDLHVDDVVPLKKPCKKGKLADHYDNVQAYDTPVLDHAVEDHHEDAPAYGVPDYAPSYGVPNDAPSYNSPSYDAMDHAVEDHHEDAPAYGVPDYAPSYNSPIADDIGQHYDTPSYDDMDHAVEDHHEDAPAYDVPDDAPIADDVDQHYDAPSHDDLSHDVDYVHRNAPKYDHLTSAHDDDVDNQEEDAPDYGPQQPIHAVNDDQEHFSNNGYFDGDSAPIHAQALASNSDNTY